MQRISDEEILRLHKALGGKGLIYLAFIEPAVGFYVGKKLEDLGLIKSKAQVYKFLSDFEREGLLRSEVVKDTRGPRKIRQVTITPVWWIEKETTE